MKLDKPLAFTLKWEGGKVDNKNDRGGRTAFGITQSTYNEWCERKGKPQQDVWLITKEDVAAIYDEQYWRRVRGALLPAPLDTVVFDSAVQHGVGRAVRWLQEVVGADVDGVFGDQTMEAVKTAPTSTTVAKYLDRRERFYDAVVANDPSQQVFAKGWGNRMAALRKEVAKC